jgi:hypothetical protein
MKQKIGRSPSKWSVRSGLLAPLIIAALSLNAQNIYTIAGTGALAYSGDGGPATTAAIIDIGGTMTIDPSGNLYIGFSPNVTILSKCNHT